MGELLAAEPLARVDYVSVADAETLEELEKIDRTALVSLAVRIGKTRLLATALCHLMRRRAEARLAGAAAISGGRA